MTRYARHCPLIFSICSWLPRRPPPEHRRVTPTSLSRRIRRQLKALVPGWESLALIPLQTISLRAPHTYLAESHLRAREHILQPTAICR
jgi:hypothetical protein